jgi:hypothetical protein
MLEYFCTDGRIRVATSQLQHQPVVSSGDTTYIVVEVASDMELEAEPYTTENEAWNACLLLKAMRGGNKGVREKRWTDKKGLRHVKAELDNTVCISKHHWYVEEFVVDGAIQTERKTLMG